MVAARRGRVKSRCYTRLHYSSECANQRRRQRGEDRNQIGNHRHGVADQGKAGDKVESGDALIIIESMKMEIPVITEDGGTVLEIRVKRKMRWPRARSSR